MTLIDTSVWIDHFRLGSERLSEMLESGACQTHEVVIGELACGTLPRREATLLLLEQLPRIRSASAEEAMWLLRHARLHGRGLGWTDLLLLASALAAETSLWTLDARLARAAHALGCA